MEGTLHFLKALLCVIYSIIEMCLSDSTDSLLLLKMEEEEEEKEDDEETKREDKNENGVAEVFLTIEKNCISKSRI